MLDGGTWVATGGIKIEGEEIRRVEGVRFLGLWVDEGLRWTCQIEQVRKKVGQLLGVFGRAGAFLGGALSSHCLIAWSPQTCSTV